MAKSKHLQLVSGVNANLYWLATYLWDLAAYLVVCLLCMLVFACYGEPAFAGTTEQGMAMFFVLWFYCVSVLPLVYCYSFLFDR